MKLKMILLLNEVQFVPKLSLNRPKTFRKGMLSVNRRKKEVEKMKVKLLSKAIVIATIITALAFVGLAYAGNYTLSATANGSWYGWVNAEASIDFDDSTYIINWDTSYQSATWDFWFGDTQLIEYYDIRADVASWSRAVVHFYPWYDQEYIAWADVRTYPSYEPDPASASQDWYYC
jgi:hypothetical protein